MPPRNPPRSNSVSLSRAAESAASAWHRARKPPILSCYPLAHLTIKFGYSRSALSEEGRGALATTNS